MGEQLSPFKGYIIYYRIQQHQKMNPNLKRSKAKQFLLEAFLVYRNIRSIMQTLLETEMDGVIDIDAIYEMIEDHKLGKQLFQRQIKHEKQLKFMRDLECELRNFSQRDERNKKICIPLFMNIKMFFDILYSRYKDYFYSEICRNNCVLRQIRQWIELLQNKSYLCLPKTQKSNFNIVVISEAQHHQHQIGEHNLSSSISKIRQNSSKTPTKSKNSNVLTSLGSQRTTLNHSKKTSETMDKSHFKYQSCNNFYSKQLRQNSCRKFLKTNTKKDIVLIPDSFNKQKQGLFTNSSQVNINIEGIQIENQQGKKVQKNNLAESKKKRRTGVNYKNDEFRLKFNGSKRRTFTQQFRKSANVRSSSAIIQTERKSKSQKRNTPEAKSLARMLNLNDKTMMGHPKNDIAKSGFYKKYAYKDAKKGQIKNKMKKRMLSVDRFSQDKNNERSENRKQSHKMYKQQKQELEKLKPKEIEINDQQRVNEQGKKDKQVRKGGACRKNENNWSSSSQVSVFTNEDKKKAKRVSVKEFEDLKLYFNNYLEQTSEQSIFFRQQEHKLQKENQSFQQYLKRMYYYDNPDMKEPFGIQKYENMMKENKILELQRNYTFKADSEWIHNLKPSQDIHQINLSVCGKGQL